MTGVPGTTREQFATDGGHAHEDDEQAESGASSRWDLGHALHHSADVTVDVAAVAALYGLASSGVPEATAQVLGGFVVSVALGKRYAEHRLGSRGGA